MIKKSVMCCLLCVSIVCISVYGGKKITVPTDYKSVQQAINECEEGDTVYVLNGRYKENIVMADGMVLMGESAAETILRGNNSDPVVKAANNSILRNFTIKRGGIGIISENTNMLIQNNLIKENGNTGIQCLVSLPHIQNNIILDNGWSGVFCELVAYGTRTAIEHNIIARNGYSGVNLSRKSGVLVQNNVFYRNKQFGIHVSKDSRKSRLIYNDFFMNRREYNNFAVIDATNISKDPEFPKDSWSNIDAFLPPANAIQVKIPSTNKLVLIMKNPKAKDVSTKFDTLLVYDNPLDRLGKNGASIGLVTPEGLKKLFKDSDEDGIADDEDKCPEIMEDFDGFADEDGCPDYDNDEDGIYDTKDKCPDEAEDFDGFLDRDGCPDPDNDGDDILDTVDKCPNRAETYNFYKDEDGCPDEKPDEEPEKKRK